MKAICFLSLITFLFLVSLTSGSTEETKEEVNSVTGSPAEEELVAEERQRTRNEAIKYYLHTSPKAMDERVEIKIGDVATLLKNPKPNSIKLLVHGFLADSFFEFPVMVKNAYLELIANTSANLAVIVMDYGSIAKPSGGLFGKIGALLQYREVASMANKVGKDLVRFLEFLVTSAYVPGYERIHLISFSLGAHICGIAGHEIRRKTRIARLGRITGIDPAGPEFKNVEAMRKLSPQSAAFVDVIHVNDAKLGHPGELGHVDFFPNGGSSQPGCNDNSVLSLSNYFTGCSHFKGYKYFVQSIRNNNIKACKCSTWDEFQKACGTKCPNPINFGEKCPTSARGRYYLRINEE